MWFMKFSELNLGKSSDRNGTPMCELGNFYAVVQTHQQVSNIATDNYSTASFSVIIPN